MSIEKRIRELGLQLPKVPTPAANYANAVRTGNLVYLSGTVPARPDGTIPKGKVGADVSTDEAAEHARLAGLNILAILKEELGDLDRARRVIKLLGMVNAVPDFREHSRVINAAPTCSRRFSARNMPAPLSGWEVCRSASRSRSKRSSRSIRIDVLFAIHHSPFTFHHSLFTIPFAIHHSPFTFHRDRHLLARATVRRNASPVWTPGRCPRGIGC